MASSDSPLDYVDYTLIRFPSDRITVGDVRRVHPERFDVEGAEHFEYTQNDPKFTLNLIFYLERIVARTAYEEAIGKTEGDIQPRIDREDCIEELSRFYTTYGVASGIHKTEQLVRDIESQAVAQAVGRQR